MKGFWNLGYRSTDQVTLQLLPDPPSGPSQRGTLRVSRFHFGVENPTFNRGHARVGLTFVPLGQLGHRNTFSVLCLDLSV